MLKKACRVLKSKPLLANGALKNISGHLWYLNDELVMLAIFYDNGTIEEKLKMISQLTTGPTHEYIFKMFETHINIR